MSPPSQPVPPMERISVRIPAAVSLTGLSRSRIYQLMKDGQIEYAKVGSSTLIMVDSLRRFVDSRRMTAGKAPSGDGIDAPLAAGPDTSKMEAILDRPAPAH